MSSEFPFRRRNTANEPRDHGIANEPRNLSRVDNPRRRDVANESLRRGASGPRDRTAADDGLEELRRMSHDQDWLGRRPVAAPQRKKPSRRTNPAAIAIGCAIVAIALIIAVAMFLLR